MAAGDLAGARTAELAAQADFDGLRSQLTWNAPATLALDARSVDVTPGTPFAGLHRVEKGLWPGGTGWQAGVSAEVSGLAARGRAAPGGPAARRPDPPADTPGRGGSELGWIDASPVPGLEEA